MTISITQTSGLIEFDNFSGAVTFHMVSNFAAHSSAVVPVSIFNNNTDTGLTSVVAGGTSLTRRIQQAGSTTFYAELWQADDLAGGVNTVVFTGGTGWYIVGGCDEVAGLVLTGSFGQSNPASGTNTAPTITTAVLAQPNEIVYANAFENGGSTIAFTMPGAPWSTLYQEQDFDNHMAGSATRQIVSATTALTATWSYASSVSWFTFYATFKGAATAAAADSMFFGCGTTS